MDASLTFYKKQAKSSLIFHKSIIFAATGREP